MKKAKEIGTLNSKKIFADTMLSLHPTKKKVCQNCGRTMSLYYLYPSKNLIIEFQESFNYKYDKYDDIFEILKKYKKQTNLIFQLLIKRVNKKDFKDINELIWHIEDLCRNNGKRIFSPGAMSDFPDRYDGFHSYNLCCRKLKDKGRSDKNMATYNKDRRAYEYWADGNIAAANALMGDKNIFKDNISADHIGPISLGFIHDPIYIEPMSRSDNSAKRDKLNKETIDKIIKIEKVSKVAPVSFFSKDIWEFIKKDLNNNNSTLKIEDYHSMLKQNMNNFMESLWIILNSEKLQDIENFLELNYFKPKYDKYFRYKYKFNSEGKILEKKVKNITDATSKEYQRFIRISYDSINEFKLKQNRKIKSTLTKNDKAILSKIVKKIEDNENNIEIISEIKQYLQQMQFQLIESFEK